MSVYMVQKATFGAGCFWGVQSAFDRLEGIVETTVGYMGGELENPSYEQVCSGKTGHVEVVEVKFDPSVISFEQLLEVFFRIHDPTQLNRQGPDVGWQYRSVVFFHSQQQKQKTLELLSELPNADKVVTSVEPASTFYPAEKYHQKYFEKNAGGCRSW